MLTQSCVQEAWWEGWHKLSITPADTAKWGKGKNHLLRKKNLCFGIVFWHVMFKRTCVQWRLWAKLKTFQVFFSFLFLLIPNLLYHTLESYLWSRAELLFWCDAKSYLLLKGFVCCGNQIGIQVAVALNLECCLLLFGNNWDVSLVLPQDIFISELTCQILVVQDITVVLMKLEWDWLHQWEQDDRKRVRDSFISICLQLK